MQTTQQTDGNRRAAKPTIFTLSGGLEAKCEELLLAPGGWQSTGGLGQCPHSEGMTVPEDGSQGVPL